jgi:hypothetical protein
LPRDYLRWFDYWLKGVENGVPKEPLVSIFVMGGPAYRLSGQAPPSPAPRRLAPLIRLSHFPP